MFLGISGVPSVGQAYATIVPEESGPASQIEAIKVPKFTLVGKGGIKEAS